MVVDWGFFPPTGLIIYYFFKMICFSYPYPAGVLRIKSSVMNWSLKQFETIRFLVQAFGTYMQLVMSS